MGYVGGVVYNKRRLLGYMLDSKVKLSGKLNDPRLDSKQLRKTEKSLFILDFLVESLLTTETFSNVSVKVSPTEGELVIFLHNRKEKSSEIFLINYLDFIGLFTGLRKGGNIKDVIDSLESLDMRFEQHIYICCLESIKSRNYIGKNFELSLYESSFLDNKLRGRMNNVQRFLCS